MTRLLHDIAHLGHAELLTPEPENSLWFFTEVLGLTENGTSGDSVYLRTWDDYEYHSLKLTASATSGIGRTGLRAASEQALERRVAEIERHGLGAGWQDGDLGIGPTYLFRDPDGHELHHVAFATDTREDVLRAADICLDRQVFIETGPHKHAIQQTFFLYVYERGGNRIELCNPCARLIFAPDWETITWSEAERAKGQAWGLKAIASFHTHGTPPVQ